MHFAHKKLPAEFSREMRLFPISSIKPYALMLAPVYVFMRLNQKFVAVKAPLDFFTPEELDQYRPYESFFMPPCVDQSIEFRETAKRARALLNWNVARREQLAPAPFEVSDALLRLVGPLWTRETKLDPFFVAVFANELCDLISPQRLHGARESDVRSYERAVFCSSWAVWLAIHLGYCELRFLNGLRTAVYDRAVEGEPGSMISSGDEIEDLVKFSLLTEAGKQAKFWDASVLETLPGRLGQKLSSRMKRVKSEIAVTQNHSPSIHDAGGFAHV